jgi:hypothetical protein
MLGIDGNATISGDACRVSVAGLGPRRRVSRSLKAACSQVRNLGIDQDSLNLPYSSWLENTDASSVIRNATGQSDDLPLRLAVVCCRGVIGQAGTMIFLE